MATLIRLKQIESSSALTSASAIGEDFSSSVYEIIDAAGLFSSSTQVDLVQASNYDGFVVQLDMTMSSDLEASIISSSISQSLVILSQTYVTTASLDTLSSSLATTDSQSLYLIGLLSSSVQATSGDFSASVASQFSSSYATIYSISSSFDTTIDNLSSSIQTSLSASEAGQLVLSGSIYTTINNLSSSVATSLSASEANVISISSSIHTSISSSNATFTAFSNSIDDIIKDKMNVEGVISSSAQLAGATLTGITLVPKDADSYSLIVSGAVAIVDAIGLSGSLDGDLDTNVPAQLWINGVSGSGSSAPIDPSIGGEAQSNMIDMGEW